jgi:outer membrane lipoprotein-sorting protein
MITLRVWFVMISVVLPLVSGVWTAVATPAHAAEVSTRNTTVREMLDDLNGTPAEPRVDVYGNEIEDALGDYRIDPSGDVYERHSPETEVARLASPVS